ncbi:MAG: glycosyltransferase, partial [Candidatus Bathyarchaeia archaeon]
IQSFLFPDNLITRLAGKPKGTIVINGKRDVDRYKSPFRIIADIATVGLCDYIISNSKAGIDEWLKRGMDRKKLIYIPNGKDFSYLRVKDSRDSVRKELGLDKNEIAIGIVARLDVQKGHIYLLEALKMVIKERPTIKLFLVGDGPLKRKLQKLCLRLGIKEKVVFLGTRRDVPRLLKAFDIFVLPSLWEGMSGALMEAMAVGLPVIATAVDGNLELIEDGKNGVLAPPKDPISLKQKLMDLIYNPEKSRRLARNATKIIKNYSIKNMVSQYEATFKKVVSKKI